MPTYEMHIHPSYFQRTMTLGDVVLAGSVRAILPVLPKQLGKGVWKRRCRMPAPSVTTSSHASELALRNLLTLDANGSPGELPIDRDNHNTEERKI